jgi:hypothetical protein
LRYAIKHALAKCLKDVQIFEHTDFIKIKCQAGVLNEPHPYNYAGDPLTRKVYSNQSQYSFSSN